MSTQNRHLSDRLIKTIEANAEELAQGTVKKLQTSSRTESYHNLAHRDLYNRSYEIYHNLGLWLWEKSDHAIQAQYNELGQRRFEEGIPLTQVLWAVVLTKEHLLEYLAGCGLVDSAMDLYQQQEFVRLIAHFYDRALCYTAQGYERRASHKDQPSEDETEERHTRKSWFASGLHRNAHHSP
jgi:hypothetical protein